MKRIATALAALALAATGSGVTATVAHGQLPPQNRLEREVYSVYNSDCGGWNPWHKGTWWWCVNRNVELQTLSHDRWLRNGDVSYCYTEAKVGAQKERCMEVRVVWDSIQKQVVIGQMLAYWTNAG
jgi:hypothetical protein